MQLHRNRRATPPEAKSGPPLRDRSQKTAELRCLLARSPATRLHCTPHQRISESDHGVQMWSNKGLASKKIKKMAAARPVEGEARSRRQVPEAMRGLRGDSFILRACYISPKRQHQMLLSLR